VLLPVLSQHRLPEILELLHNNQGGLVPDDCRVFLDAPLVMELLECYKHLPPEEYSSSYGNDSDYYKTVDESLARFELNNLTVIGSHQDSVYNDAKMADCGGNKVIIIASGGMGEHGRSLNYINGQFGKNPKNTVLLTCFQVDGTAGAALVQSGRTRGGARVERVEGFTSHISGADETLDFLKQFDLSRLKTVLIGHGKDSARKAMEAEFKKRGYDATVILPRLNQRISV
jgi:predicted metal-dependent RNase